MEVYEKTIAEQVEKQAEIDELALQATFHQAEYEFEKEQQEYEKYMKEVEAWTLRKDVARGEYELVLFFVFVFLGLCVFIFGWI